MIGFIIKRKFSTSPYDLLHQRGQLYQFTSQLLKNNDFIPNIKQKFSTPSVYCGYDPTAESLHLGNLLSIIAMGRLSTIGLRPVFLIGGATAQIGDPSGKNKQRTLMQKDAILKNIKGVNQDIVRVYQNILNKIHKQYGVSNRQYKVIDNMDFYESFNILQFLNEVGRYFRMGVLLSKENISNRLQTQEGMAYSQFSYSLLQSYDYFKLFKTEQCILQIGGSDQWGNITNGCDYIKKREKTEVFGLTLPLLTTSNGAKFGKTQNNALFLNSDKTPTNQVYNYFYNTPDDQVEQYLKLFTFLPNQSISEAMSSHKQSSHKRIPQKLLCQQVFSILYSDKQAIHTQQRILRIRKQQLRDLKLSQLNQLIQSANTKVLKRSQLRAIRDLPQLIIYLDIKSSKAEVRREIQNGGVYLNNQKISSEIIKNPILELFEAQLLHNSINLIRFGKKNLTVIKYLLDQ